MTAEEQISSLPTSPRKPNRVLRFFRRLFVFLLLVILLLTGAGIIIGYCYQDEVKEYVIGELNKQLNTQIIVDGENIDFTVIKSFPYASVNFRQVKALEAVKREKKDTLFTAGEISFQFNILDIFKKNYRIRKIGISDADVKVRIDKDGNDNYHFWKESPDTANASFAFSLEHIDLNNIHLTWKDQKAKQTIDATVKSSRLSGNFSDRNYSLETVSDLYVERIRVDSINYLRKKNIHAELALDVDNTMPSYKISDGSIKIEDLLFQVFGNVVNTGNDPILNFGVKGKDMNIRSVLSLIPAKYKGSISDYESEGEFYFDATIRGVLSSKEIPQIRADFGTRNAEITQVKDNIRLHKVNLKGHYYNGNRNRDEVSELILSPFSATVEQGSLSGELTLKDLSSPAFDGNVKGDLRLEELQRFFHVDTIESVTGGVKLNAAFSGDYKDINAGHYDKVVTSGKLQLTDANLRLKNYSLGFSGLNGEFKFDNNDLDVGSFSGKAGSSDFLLKGSFRNVIGFIMKEEEDITVEASLNSENIDLNELLSNKQESGGGSSSKYKLKFSEHIDVNLNSEIKHLAFRKFEATNIHGIVKLKDKKLIADPVTVSTMSGTITTSGMVDGTDSTRLLVTCFSDVSRINITKMFAEFENFGQSTITDKNLKGVATAKIQFASVLSPELEMDLDKLYAGVDVTIENGEMNNVEVMKSLSRFIELKDLENIRFSTLKNQIEVKNQVITIPRMEVKSNAINIIASGTHTFNNEINYKVKLSLNELLSKKAKNAKKENDEFGEVADDGLGRTNIFLSMTGTIDNPVIRYDSKSAIQNVKNDLKVEKQTLKTILKDEFGLFKKDSTLGNKAPKEDPKFIIKWEESDKKEGSAEKKELKKPKRPEEDDY
jgi:hypothetical protein